MKNYVETIHENECCSSSDSEEISGQYKCSDCPKHFPSDSLLKLHHSLNHMQFDQSDSSFDQNYNKLAEEPSSHEKPGEVDPTEASSLYIEPMVNSGKYICPGCSEQFSSKSDLKIHTDQNYYYEIVDSEISFRKHLQKSVNVSIVFVILLM